MVDGLLGLVGQYPRFALTLSADFFATGFAAGLAEVFFADFAVVFFAGLAAGLFVASGSIIGASSGNGGTMPKR